MNFSRLDEFLDGLDARGKSCTDCAVYLDGQPVHRHMSGLANREENIPVRPDTIYRMFSMTKPITCVAMLKLYEQGRFLLTDPVSLYLPEFARPGEIAGDGAEINMRQLFTMTSGLSYDLETEPLKKLYRDKPDFTTREFVSAVAESPRLFRPGEHWCYSLAHDVLAACVEVISGMPFGEYVRRSIFEPLGIRDAWFHVPDALLSRTCVRYQYDPQERRYFRDPGDQGDHRLNTYQRSPLFESGGAGLSATLDEYAKFANMLTRLDTAPDGQRIIGARTLDMMRENQLTPAQLTDFNWIQFRGYGYGLGVRTLMSRGAAGSAGAVGEYGWGGAAGTYFLSDPKNRLTVVYCQQATPNDEPYVHPRLRNMVYAALEDGR